MKWKTIASVFASLPPLFKGKDDKFLVVEMFEHSVRAASIRADFESKRLHVLKVKTGPDLKKLLKKFGRIGKYKIIIGLDSHLASTIYSSALLPRENYKELIDEPELDNLISQAIWKFFDRSRNKVAGKIGVADMDILLTDVRIRGIKLDGYKVVNPLGFKAKTVEVQFSQTFLSRSSIDMLKEILPLNQVMLISENGTACSSVVAKADLAQENFLLANLFPGKTQLFFSEGSQNAYFDHFNWGEDNLKQSLSADLAVGHEIAGKIIEKYVKGDASDVFRRRMDHLVMKELTVLARALDGAAKKSDTRVIYMNPFFHLPSIFGQGFKNQFERSVTLQPLSLDLISQKFGFDITFKHSADAEHAFCMMAALIEWYLSPHDDKMSQLAKRRVRWLSPV